MKKQDKKARVIPLYRGPGDVHLPFANLRGKLVEAASCGDSEYLISMARIDIEEETKRARRLGEKVKPTTSLPARAIVILARKIVDDYRRQGLTLTLRQLYYQFVSLGWTPNGQKVYSKIGAALTEARYDGGFPMDSIEDRGRTVHEGAFRGHSGDAEGALLAGAGRLKDFPNLYLWFDRWLLQPEHVSVWVEKEALSGVFERPCQSLGVSWYACKGYSSVSALWEWVQNAERVARRWREFGKEPPAFTILYFGDFDPDGLEIPVTALKGIKRLISTYRIDIGSGPGIVPSSLQLVNVALTPEQIKEYNPPPFPAKTSSARYKGFVEKTGSDEAYELDALEPRVLRDLITLNVEDRFDYDIYEAHQKEIAAAREVMVEGMNTEWVRDALGLEPEGEE